MPLELPPPRYPNHQAMPEKTPNLPEEASEAMPESSESSSFLSKLKVPLFMVVVIATECVVAFLLLPDASQTVAMVDGTMAADQDGSGASGEEDKIDEEDLVDQVEVDLGEFDVTAYQPMSQTTMRISFGLWGTVSNDDQTEFEDLMAVHEHRIRDQILATIRSADVRDLTAAELGLVKRKILDKINKTLGKSLLRTAIFSDFSYIEQ